MIIVEKSNQNSCELNFQILSLSDLQYFFHHSVGNSLQEKIQSKYLEFFPRWATHLSIQLLLKGNDRLVHRVQISLSSEHAGVSEFPTERGNFSFGQVSDGRD